MISQVRLSEIISPHFYPVHKSIKDHEFGSYWLKGGRGSTKTSFCAIQAIKAIMANKDMNGIVFRKVGDTVRTSIYTSLLWATDVLGVSPLFKATLSPAELTYIPTGQQILMKGLDDAAKLKSIRPRKGYFGLLWFEELPEFNGMEEIRSVRQSVLRGGERCLELCSYNPPIDPQNWVNKESQLNIPDRMVFESTYLDVPPHWLGNRFIEQAEWLRENNPLAYEHEYMGVATGLNEAVIFSGKYKIKAFEAEPHWHGPYFGVDWGFAQDPLAAVKCWIEEVGDRKRLYIEHEAFGVGVEIDETPEFLRRIPDIDKYKTIADSARPEMVSHLKMRGFRIESAEKWKGSVEDGIAFMKNFVEIVVHTRCKNLQEEFRLYSYKIDKFTREVTPDIIDKHNHGMDAVRYSLGKMIKPRGKSRFAV